MSSVIPKGITGITIFGSQSQGSDTDFEVRSFAPNEGVEEDPVCGSGNGCVAVVVQKDSLLNRDHYIARQGTCLGRNGRVKVQFSDKDILVGGSAVTCINGDIYI
jgi:PhzF family phenazine biosynthesis protein